MKYRSRTNRIVRRVIFFLIAVSVLVCGVLYYRSVTSTLLVAIEEVMRARTAQCVNEAVLSSLMQGADYRSLVEVVRGSDGSIEAIAANSLEINRIARNTAVLAQQKLQTAGEQGVGIPVGAFFGIDALVGAGPEVRLSVIPVAVVSCRFTSEFEGAGINQTRHSIYLDVDAELSVVLPGRGETFSVCSQVLIAESVLVGKVPETYLHADIFGDGYVTAAPQRGG